MADVVPNVNPNLVLLTISRDDNAIHIYPIVGWSLAGSYDAQPITPFQFNRDAWALHDRQVGVYWDPQGNFLDGDRIADWLVARASRPQRRRR